METKLKILLVDDEKNLCQLLANLLAGNKNREILIANSAGMALDLLERETFALVLADYRLKGDETNGLDILYRAKEKNPNVITILITGYGSDQLAIRAVAEGVYDYLTKPFRSIIDVKNTVDRGLRYYELLTRFNEKMAGPRMQEELLRETLERARRTRRILRMLVSKLQQNQPDAGGK